MLNLDQEYWVLIQRFISGNADEEQRHKLNEWMNRHPENRKLVQELKEIWQLTPSEEFEVDVQATWEMFKHRRAALAEGQFKKVGYVSRKTSKKLLYAVRAAAVILVSVLAGIFVQYTLTNHNTEQISDFYVMQTLETGEGEKARVTFSDGSSVVLNSASSIRFPQQFLEANREVFLEGEAYFEVAHDPDHPFIVHAQDVEIQVLGTEFNVQGWREDTSVDVVVREGKVAVASLNNQENQEQKVVLTKGLYTSVKKGGAPSLPQPVNVTNHLLWTNGGLHFDKESFSKVIRVIERRFSVQIIGVPEGLMDVPFTSTFHQADVNEVLSVIGAAMDLEFRREGTRIYIQ